ncbi:MAG: trypsin-like peptidase domain-containing protein [Bacteroidota bacterium]
MVSKKQFWIGIVVASFLGASLAIAVSWWIPAKKDYVSFEEKQNVYFSNVEQGKVIVPEGLNFIQAANIASPAVVHIQTTTIKNAYGEASAMEDMFRQFHGKGQAPRSSSGSGVIISPDGYVATNYHVIAGTTNIEVILSDKRNYQAKIIGTAPSLDLALLKIDEEALPFTKYGNSDNVQIGEWVLAIGNPFDLTSTVTAGIISAKARSINIIRTSDHLQVESFLQTDAVVNPGNSGGALINLNGELIGINTAIASETGSYQGYSFAVPVNLVKKVMNDLLNYGELQRALLGVHIVDIDAHFAEEMGLEGFDGVYIAGVNRSSGAEEAGLQEGDVVLSIENKVVNSIAELQAIIASKKPGDLIKVKYRRGAYERVARIVLKNKSGNVEVVRKKRPRKTRVLGAELVKVNGKEKSRLRLEEGLKVKNLKAGKMLQAGIKQGFIITHLSINGKRILIKDVEDIVKASKRAEKENIGIYLEGLYTNGDKAYYPIGW